jgi:DNA repair protein RadC
LGHGPDEQAPGSVKPSSDANQISLLPPDAGAILHLVRENLRLLAELVTRYEVGHVDLSADERTIRGPADLAAYLGAELGDLAQEQLRVVLLDTRNHVIGSQLVYQGGINATAIRLADCFREAVARGAAAVIFAHNHPSGDPTPSPADIQLTTEAGNAGDLLGIELLDHIIIARQGHVSLREHGLYAPPGKGERVPHARAGGSPYA